MRLYSRTTVEKITFSLILSKLLIYENNLTQYHKFFIDLIIYSKINIIKQLIDKNINYYRL